MSKSLSVPDRIANAAKKVYEFCREDEDPVSIIAFGYESIPDADELMLVVRGKQNVEWVRRRQTDTGEKRMIRYALKYYLVAFAWWLSRYYCFLHPRYRCLWWHGWGNGRRTDITPTQCTACGWAGMTRQAHHGYQDDGSGEDVEPADYCPVCDTEVWPAISHDLDGRQHLDRYTGGLVRRERETSV